MTQPDHLDLQHRGLDIYHSKIALLPLVRSARSKFYASETLRAVVIGLREYKSLPFKSKPT